MFRPVMRVSNRPGPMVSRLLLFVLLACFGSLACGPGDSGDRIILITVDSLRPDRLASYGAAVSILPRVDQLAAEGVVFEEAYSAAPLTFPALAGLMTGQPPSAVGVVDDAGSILSTEHRRIAPLLMQAGWSTGAFVNAPHLDHESGLFEGFRRVYNPALDDDSRNPPASLIFNDAAAFLERYRRSPAFAWIHVYDTAFPYLGAGVSGDLAGRYDGSLGGADGALASFLARLDREGLLDSATIILTADHGEGLGDAGEQTHGVLLGAPTLHVPLIIRRPGVEPGRVETPVSLLDLAPTVTALAKAPLMEPAGPHDGRSLEPLLAAGGNLQGGERRLYAETFVPLFDYGWPALQRVRQGDAWVDAADAPQVADLGGAARAAQDPADVLRRFQGVVKHLSASRIGPAQKAMTPLAAEYPGVPAVALLQASVQRAAGDPEAALASLQSAASAGGAANIWVALAELRSDMGRPASSAWKKAADASPARLRFRLRYAESLLEDGQAQAALLAARDAAARMPDSAAVLRFLGRMSQLTGDFDNATRALADAAVRAPASSLTFRHLAAVALKSGNMEGALKMLDDAVEIDPAERAIQRDRGDVLAALGDLEAAKKAYRDSVPPGVDEPEGTIMVAEALARGGKLDQASALLARIIEDHPGSARAHYDQAQIQLERQRPQIAEQEFRAALEAGGEQVRIYYGLARAALMQSDETSAIAYMDRVFASDDPVVRRALRADALFASPDRSSELRSAVQRYLSGAAAPRDATP